jgi:hypothetical protein
MCLQIRVSLEDLLGPLLKAVHHLLVFSDFDLTLHDDIMSFRNVTDRERENIMMNFPQHRLLRLH